MKRKCDEFEDSVQKKVKYETSLLDMPKEILFIIFDLITPHDRRNLCETCYYVLNIINDRYAKELFINLSDGLDFSVNGRLYKTFSNASLIWPIKNLVIDGFSSFSTDVVRCLESIGSFIRNLELKLGCWNLKFDLWEYFPYLESITVPHFQILDEIPNIPSSLKRIVISGPLEIEDVIMMQLFRKLNDVVVECKKLYLSRKCLNNRGIVIFTGSLKQTLIQISKFTNLVVIDAVFNYNGDQLMDFKHITGITLSSKSESFEIIRKFENLQAVKLVVSQDEQLSFAGVEPFLNVKFLEIIGNIDIQVLTDMLLKFPSLETLEITDANLRDEHFYVICKLEPNLKRLVLISLTAVFTLHPFTDPRTEKPSLKSLTKLEELIIVCNTEETLEYSEQQMSLPIIWPTLPKLKTLDVDGYAFKDLDDPFIEIIGQKFKALQSFSFQRINPRVPVLSVLNAWPNQLTHLFLNEVGSNWYFIYHSDFLKALFKNGSKLKEISLTFSRKCVTLQDMVLFFREIKTLECVNIMLDTTIISMSRHNYKNLKGFIKKNIRWFILGLLDSTLSFVLKELMHCQTTEEIMKNKFAATGMVLTYLEISPSEICETLMPLIYKPDFNDYEFN